VQLAVSDHEVDAPKYGRAVESRGVEAFDLEQGSGESGVHGSESKNLA
jgi:hypothetical protein